MNTSERLLRWASGIMVTLGAGHLMLLPLVAGDTVVGWVKQGLWAAVPLLGSGDAVDPETVQALRDKATFWGGPGSFAVPLILLGCLVWHLAGRGVAVPAWIGWGLGVWCLLGGVLLVPSPYFAGTVAGVLVVLAKRDVDRRAMAEPVQ